MTQRREAMEDIARQIDRDGEYRQPVQPPTVECDHCQTPPLTTAQATRIMGDLFPRPRGARGVDDAASLSTTEDVNRLREWRSHRALRGIDHHRLHFAEGELASEWAGNVLEVTIGGDEVDG